MTLMLSMSPRTESLPTPDPVDMQITCMQMQITTSDCYVRSQQIIDRPGKILCLPVLGRIFASWLEGLPLHTLCMG